MSWLHSLIERGRRTEFERLLSKQPDRLHERNSQGEMPLHIAAWQNKVEMLRRLVGLGADLQARGECGWSPLHYAAKHGALSSARELIRAGADLNAPDDDDFWPIHFALRGREPQCVEIADLLDKAGASLDLSCHVMRGDEAKVRAMLAHNPNALHEGPLARDLVYDAALWIGCQVMKIDCQTHHQRNEAARPHFGLLLALLEAGADPDDFLWSGQTALKAARDVYRIPALTELLIAHGAKLLHPLRPPAHHFCSINSTRVVTQCPSSVNSRTAVAPTP